MGFWLGTLGFAAVEIALYGGIALTGNREKRGINQLLAATAVTCCWLLWAIVYLGAVYPLVRPVLQ